MERSALQQSAEHAQDHEPGVTRATKGRLRLSIPVSALGYLAPAAMAALVLMVGWELWVRLSDMPVYIVPGPLAVLRRLFGDVGFFAGHGATTLMEAGAGFFLGSLVAVVAATLMAHSRMLERILLPLAVVVKVTPIVAIAPLFVIWFGFGSTPKILIAAIITFFPVMVNANVGLRAVDPGALDLFRSLHASRVEILLKLRAPSSLPYLFAAFRIAVPLSVIGAVVGEWFTGDQGLGSVIIVAHNDLDTPTLFAAIFSLAIIGVSLTLATFYVEKRMLFWHDSFLA
ncbi:MAG: ABC transporter permease [SAR202 cluster bacterium]|nr:ABC transporter permease [SAR202 cluster bacterium]